MKGALCTGHAGLIGRHIADRLAERGFTVTCVDTRGVPAVDARDFFRRDGTRFDVAIHCAAVVGGRALIDGPALAHAENLEIDAAFFRWLTRTRPRQAVYVSSCAAYPQVLQMKARLLREDDLNFAYLSVPDQLYGWAKLTGEYLAQRAQADGVNVLVVRPFGVYGPGQADVHPLADFIRQALTRADPMHVWGSGEQARDFIHVTDVADAIMTLLANDASGPTNLCTERAVTLREAAQLIAAAVGYHPRVDLLPDKPAGLPYRVGSTSRLEQYFRPSVTLEAGISQLIGKRS